MRPLLGTSASLHPTLNGPSLFCTFRAVASRRHERQMQRRFGPAWRSLGVTAAPTPTPETTESVLLEFATSCDHNRVFQREVSAPPASHISDTVVSPKIRTDVRAKAVELGLALEDHDVPRTREYSSDVSASGDPLLEFLEKNEEDAAILLSMWTSLRRSCLHASEISESVSLRARWFLHHLIHRRAIDAAVRFYQRLLTLGVQLQKWDVVLLLSNLPYERSTTAAESQSKMWVEEEDSSLWTKRQLMEKRRRGESTEILRQCCTNSGGSSSSSSSGSSSGTVVGDVHGGTDSCKMSDLNSLDKQEAREDVKNDKFSLCETLTEPIGKPRGRRDDVPVSAVGGEIPVIGTRLFHEQSDWVKRWVMYEASMGNIDMHDETIPSTLVSQTINDESCIHDGMNEYDRLIATTEANRMIEVTALLNHLMLLHDASKTIVSSLHGGKQKEKGSITRRKVSLASKRYCYWKEAFHLGNVYISSRTPSKRGLSLSIEFLLAMQRVVRGSGSWKISLRYLQTAEKRDIQLYKADYMIFILLALPAEPWVKNRSVEQFVARHVIPKFADETTSGYAVHAIWLAHICSVKVDAPERYMELMNGRHTTNLPAAIKQCMAFVKLATSQLYIEVNRYRAETAAQEVLATSIKLGLFSHESTSLQHQNQNGGGVLMKKQNEHATEVLSGAILPDSIIHSFRLVCMTLPRIVALASVAVDSKASALNLSTLLLDTLYGPVGVWGIFSELYMAEDVASVRRAPERILIATELLLCLIRVTLTLCLNNVDLFSQRRGISLLTVKELILLLGIMVEVLGVIPTRVTLAKDHPQQRSQQPEEGLMFFLVNEFSRLVRKTFRFLGISPTSEKVLFGSTGEETVEAVVLVVRFLLRLHTEFSWSRIPMSTRLTIRSIMGHDGGLGKQVRRHLRQKELQHLHRLLHIKRRKRIISDNNNKASSYLIRPRSFSSEDIERIKNRAKLHEVIYSLSLRHENDAPTLEHALTTQLRMVQWNDALMMMHIALHHLRLSPGTLGISFFAGVLERLRSGAKSSANGTSLWLQAVSVYWDAVDHTACRSSSSSLLEMDKKRPFQKHERLVLSELLVPMMLLSMSIMRRDVGWTWLNTWSSLHSSEERDIHWMMLNIRARSALRDSRALPMSLRLFQDEKRHESTTTQRVTQASLQSLICEVAVRHNNWCVALESLLGAFAPSSSVHKSPTTPLPLPVVTSLMRILGRAPVNLSNTALRLRALQGDCWDLPNSNVLLLLLVRQRRWRLALQHVEEMIPCMTTSNNAENVDAYGKDNKNSEHMKLVRALFLLYGLRACASGGCSAEAALLYDKLKVLLGESSAVGLTERTAPENRVTCLEDVLFSAAAMLSVTPGEDGERIRAIASQARVYFLRAMTKKMLMPRSNNNEQSL